MSNTRNASNNNDCRLDGNNADNKAKHRSTRAMQPNAQSTKKTTTKAAKRAAAGKAVAGKVTVVNLSDIISALEMTTDQSQAYFDTKTGEILWQYDFEPCFSTISSEDLEADDRKRYISLPDQYEIYEYHMMEVFAYDYDDSGKLERAIQGRGAFRRFKDTVYELGLEQEWDEFRSNCYRERAVNWCHGSGIDFKE